VTWGIHTHNDAELAVRQLHRRRSGREYATCRRPSTATASAAARQHGCRCSRTSPSRRKLPLLPIGGGSIADLTKLSRFGRGDRERRPERLTSRSSAGPPSPQGRRPRRGGREGRNGATSTSTRPRSVTPDAWSSASSAARRNTRIRAEQLGLKLEGVVDAKELSQIIKAARGRRPGVRRRGGVVRAPDPPPDQGLRGAVPGRRLHGTRGAARGARAAGPRRPSRSKVEGEVLHTAADGNGPVNALDAALRKALRAFLTRSSTSVHLVDYKGAYPGRPGGTAARTRVVIDSTDGTEERGAAWSTMGSDTNIILGIGGGAGRLPRVRDLESRRGACAPRRAPLHGAHASGWGRDEMRRRDLHLVRLDRLQRSAGSTPGRGSCLLRATTSGMRRPTARARSGRSSTRWIPRLRASWAAGSARLVRRPRDRRDGAGGRGWWIS